MHRTLLFCALLGASTLAHAEDSFRLGVGVDYSSGEYGSNTRTDILSIPLSAAWGTGSWSFKASLPWMRVDGDPNVVPGVGAVVNVNPLGRGRRPIGVGVGGGTTSPPATQQEGSASGIGDLRLAATYSFDTGGDLGVDLTANVKVATADEDKGLGTGASDYGLALGLYRNIGGSTVFGGVGYTALGDSDFIDVDGVLGANVGLSWPVGGGNVGASYEWREAASSGFDDRSEVTAFYSVGTRDGGKWQVYALAGLSDGSPDFGAGVSYSHAY